MLELRRDRMSTVRQVIEGLTAESLDAQTKPVEGPGWPPPRSFPVRDCLLVILNEEWEHRLYAERDLDALEAHRPTAERHLTSARPMPHPDDTGRWAPPLAATLVVHWNGRSWS